MERGVDDVKVDGIIVNDDVETEEVIELHTDGSPIVDTSRVLTETDPDDGQFYGVFTLEDNLGFEDGIDSGTIRSLSFDTGLDEEDLPEEI